MIPKIIHYCWFGTKPLPPLAVKCIKSWKKFLPNYELKEWNEKNFDINSNPYVQEAYQARKYAFVTDYVRLYALYNYGGIYMDTDVQVLKNLDCFLDLPAFSGFEDEVNIPTGIMASEYHGEWAKWQLSFYDNKHFLKSDGTPDLTTNVRLISDSMAADGFILKNGFQNHKDMIHIFPKDYFCPKSYENGKIYKTENTYCIHHFAGSWETKWDRCKLYIVRRIGKNNVEKIGKIKRGLLGIKK